MWNWLLVGNAAMQHVLFCVVLLCCIGIFIITSWRMLLCSMPRWMRAGNGTKMMTNGATSKWILWVCLLACRLTPCNAAEFALVQSLKESCVEFMSTRDSPVYNLAWLLLLFCVACLWDRISSGKRKTKKSSSRKGQKIKKPKKWKSPKASQKQINSHYKCGASALYVAFAARRVRKARRKKARIYQRRQRQLLHQKRLYFWALGHTNRMKIERRNPKRPVAHVLPSPLWWPWTHEFQPYFQATSRQWNVATATATNQPCSAQYVRNLPFLRDCLQSDNCDMICPPSKTKEQRQRHSGWTKKQSSCRHGKHFACDIFTSASSLTDSSKPNANHSFDLPHLRHILKGGAGGSSRKNAWERNSNSMDHSSHTNSWQNRQKRRKTEHATKSQGGLRDCCMKKTDHRMNEWRSCQINQHSSAVILASSTA